MPHFERYIGIYYSGAQTPTSSLTGLRVYCAEGASRPRELEPPPSHRKHWTRKGVAQFLERSLSEDRPTLVGIDHGFSFPLQYFETHQLSLNWPEFLDDFCKHWPTDGDDVWVDFIRDGRVGDGSAREGKRTWRRLTEKRAGAAKSVFHFDVQVRVSDQRERQDRAIVNTQIGIVNAKIGHGEHLDRAS